MCELRTLPVEKLKKSNTRCMGLDRFLLEQKAKKVCFWGIFCDVE